MQFDPFATAGDSLTAPAKNAFPITLHVDQDLPMATKAVYIGTGGDLVIRAVDSEEDVILKNVPPGAILPIRVRAVRDSSTAADIIGLA
ncbi:spike base protein, RCAP_Rcc01079 family [Aurantiacibacter poecillastricola]|uniref:spike base protein, RCAP_Rcc01079 family n=1 Tax=Aurantiacibacter poecillastricola TaxID=3064385 RepID=UPI00273CFE59|nr:hypothetical protein [Aurantiacibacter sp. 219JJ12-13]MDP5260706.1 hypothetical protein [Aurantiacibacter sp. 219JJ12-13]